MRKIFVSLMLLMGTMSMNAAVSVDRIEPTNWYVVKTCEMRMLRLIILVFASILSQNSNLLTISWFIST